MKLIFPISILWLLSGRDASGLCYSLEAQYKKMMSDILTADPSSLTIQVYRNDQSNWFGQLQGKLYNVLFPTILYVQYALGRPSSLYVTCGFSDDLETRTSPACHHLLSLTCVKLIWIARYLRAKSDAQQVMRDETIGLMNRIAPSPSLTSSPSYYYIKSIPYHLNF